MKLYNNLRLDPAVPDRAAGGTMNVTPAAPDVSGGRPSAAPFQMDGQMPDSLKNLTVDLGEIESEVPSTVPAEADSLNPEGVKEATVVTQPATTPVKPAVAVTPPVLKPGELPKLPEIKQPVTVTPVTSTIPAKPGERDYSVFTEDEAKIAKKCPNEQFSLLYNSRKAERDATNKLTETSAKLAEREKGGIPGEWYNSPDAYLLHPDFQGIHANASKAQFEAEHYKQQAIAIENNQEWCIIKGYDNKGTPVFSEMYKPDASAKINVNNYMQTANQLAANHNAQMQQFAGGFKQYYTGLLNKVDTIVEQRWPWVKDAKDPRHVRAQEFDTATPKEFHNHPSHKVARLMWTTIFDLAKQVDDANARAATGKTVKEIQAEVEPTVNSTPSVSAGEMRRGAKGGKGAVTSFSVDDEVFKD